MVTQSLLYGYVTRAVRAEQVKREQVAEMFLRWIGMC
jgi:hypothetical protein